MASKQVRIRIEPDLWQAVEAVAKARKMAPSDLVSEALKVYLGPGTLIETAAELAREHVAKVHEMADLMRMLTDYIIDRTPGDIKSDMANE